MDMGLSENGGIPPIFGLVLVGHTWKTWCFFCRALGLPPIFETDDIKVFGATSTNIVMWSATKDRGHGMDMGLRPGGRHGSGAISPQSRIPSHETLVGRYFRYDNMDYDSKSNQYV